MRTCETNFESAAVAYEEPGLFYDPIETDEQVMYDEPESEREIPSVKKSHVHTRGIKAGEKKGRGVSSDIGFYFGQLKKFSKEYLSPEKIKSIYDSVRDYERAILTIFYVMDSFQEGLNEIKRTFERKDKTGKKSNNHSPYTKEQLQFIAKISRKPLYKNDDKEAEISRVMVILERLCTPKDRQTPRLDFQALFERLPFKNDSYVDFINYLHNMVGRIEANKWGEKTKKATAALQTYSGVNYTKIRDAFIFLNTINELDFEGKYYYQKPFSYLKKITRGMDPGKPDRGVNQPGEIGLDSLSGVAPDLARKSIERTAGYEQEITNLLNHFSEQYFRYVIFVAKRFMNGRLSFSDIIQEGNIGLLKAVKKFNYELGHKFITYAFWWIRQGITRALADQSRTIRVPFHIHQEYYNIKKAMPGYKKNIWDEPDYNYMSAVTGKSEKQLKKIFELFEYPLSLNQEIKRGSSKSICAFKPDIKAIDPCVQLEKATLKEDIYYYLNSLTKREVELIEMRFGLKDGNECTLDEVARKLCVTRERVRQIELKVLTRLKKCGEDRLKPHLKCNYEDVDYCIN